MNPYDPWAINTPTPTGTDVPCDLCGHTDAGWIVPLGVCCERGAWELTICHPCHTHIQTRQEVKP